MMIGALAVLMYLVPAQRGRWILSEKHLLKLDKAAFTNSKITVYQSQGQKGEVNFSDHQDGRHNEHTRVVDTAKGTTFHTILPGQTEQSSSSDDYFNGLKNPITYT